MKGASMPAVLTGAVLVSLVVADPAAASAVLWPDNGHIYDLIEAPLDWHDARADAIARGGHLATVTSAEENLFITDTFGAGAIHYHWLGGFQPDGSSEPDGGWSWVTGESFDYTRWATPGEPNNFFGTENVTIFDHDLRADGKPWNDITSTVVADGYVLEFSFERGLHPSNPLLPFLTDEGVMVFRPTPGVWYDPPFADGFVYELLGGAEFTEVAPPPASYGFGPVTLEVGGIPLAVLDPGELYTFGAGVTSFALTGISPVLDIADPGFSTAFPTFLNYSGSATELSMRGTSLTGVPAPATLGLAGAGLLLVTMLQSCARRR